MYRRHLRSKNCIILPHLLGKQLLLERCRAYLPLSFLVFLLLNPKCRKQRSHSYSRRAEIVYLVYLQTGVYLVAVRKYLVHLVCRYGVETAAEAVKLYKIQIVTRLDIVCRRIKPRMIYPLVINSKRPFKLCQIGYGILRKHRKAIGIYHIRYAVMDFRINVIRAACKHYSAASVFLHPLYCLASFFAYVVTRFIHFLPACMTRFAYLACRNI